MVRLAHDSNGPVAVKCQQVLGEASPLEFDEDGYAYVDDRDAADLIAALHTHVTVEPAAPGPDEGGDGADDRGDESDDPDSDDFDAAAFVDRTPMADVVDDIASGDYDDHLDAIESAADRAGVQDAIDARRA